MMESRILEVLCVQETKWRGYRARMMVGGRTLLHAGGDGRSSGVGIVISEEISKEVVRIERWKGRIIMAWETEQGEEENVGKYGWGTRNREGQALVELMTRNGLAFVGSFVQKRENHKITYRNGQHKTELELVLIRKHSYGGSMTLL